jgi:anti-anti-sigma regulatory factor
MIQTPDDLNDRPGAHDVQIPLGTVRAQGGVWTWSASVYAMHGFEPGEIVPTAEVMLAHCHPADRARLASVLVADDSELSYAVEQYRLIDARGGEHWVALTVECEPNDGLIYGSMLDLTARHASASAEAVTSMLSEALESCSVIDQAKGAIQLVYGTDESTAFNLLKSYSQQTNVKLRAVASNIVDSLSSVHALPAAMKHLLDEDLLDPGSQGADGRSGRAFPPSEEVRQPFELKLLIEPDAVVVVVSGDVDLATAPAFARALRSACSHASAQQGVLVDLTGCPHVGPAGLTELASARRRLAPRSAAISAVVTDEMLNPEAVAELVDTAVVPARGSAGGPRAGVASLLRPWTSSPTSPD